MHFLINPKNNSEETQDSGFFEDPNLNIYNEH